MSIIKNHDILLLNPHNEIIKGSNTFLQNAEIQIKDLLL